MFNQHQHQYDMPLSLAREEQEHVNLQRQQYSYNSQPNNNNIHSSIDILSHIGAHHLLSMAHGGNNVHPQPFFISSKTFHGARAGYVFRTSTEGTGYYLDVQTPLHKKYSKETLMKNKQKAKSERERRIKKHYSDIIDNHEKIEKKVEIVNMGQLSKIMESNGSLGANPFVSVIQMMEFGMVRNPSTRGKNLSNLYNGAVVKYSDGTFSAVPVQQFKLEKDIPCMAKDGAHKGAEEMFAFRLTDPFTINMFNSEHIQQTMVIIRWESDRKLCVKSIEQVWDRDGPRRVVPLIRYVPGESGCSGTVTKVGVSKLLIDHYEQICELGKKRYTPQTGMGISPSKAETVEPKYFLLESIGEEQRQTLLDQLRNSMDLVMGSGRSKELPIDIIKKAVYLAIDYLGSSSRTGSSAHAIKKHILRVLLPEVKNRWSDAIYKDALNDKLLGVNKPDFTEPNLRLGILHAINNDPRGDGRSATAIKKYMVNKLLFEEDKWVNKDYIDVLKDAVKNGEVLERLERIPLDEMMARSDSSTRMSGGMSTVTVELSLTYDIIRGNILGSLPHIDVMGGDSANHNDADQSLYLSIMKDSEERMSVATCLKERREKRGICKELGCENSVKSEFHKLQVCWQHAPTNLRKEVSEKRKRKRDESKGQLCYSVAPPPWCISCHCRLVSRGTCLHCMS